MHSHDYSLDSRDRSSPYFSFSGSREKYFFHLCVDKRVVPYHALVCSRCRSTESDEVPQESLRNCPNKLLDRFVKFYANRYYRSILRSKTT